MRIFLIRHGESEANVNLEIMKQVPDHRVQLTDKGQKQAQEAGKKLNVYFKHNPPQVGGTNADQAMGMMQNILGNIANGEMKSKMNEFMASRAKARLWNSPYDRARDTAAIIRGNNSNYLNPISRESVFLVERNWGGYCHAHSNDEKETFGGLNTAFNLQSKDGGAFWARPPNGESLMDVAGRIQLAINQIHQEAELLGVSDHVVVGHANSLKVFVMLWCGLPYEWYENEKDGGNCSIRLLADTADKGYIFGGYINGMPAKREKNQYDR